MSTHCMIWCKNNLDNSFDGIYCHFDGYINGGVGEILVKYYNQTEAKQLMLVGDIKNLEFTPFACEGIKTGHIHVDSIEQIIQHTKTYNIHYTYVLISDVWYVFDQFNKELETVKSHLNV